MLLRLEAEIEEAHLKAKEEMIQGIQMAKEVAQKELCDQKVLYENRIRALEKELVQLDLFMFYLEKQIMFIFYDLFFLVAWPW